MHDSLAHAACPTNFDPAFPTPCRKPAMCGQRVLAAVGMRRSPMPALAGMAILPPINSGTIKSTVPLTAESM
jgi:hypothetical protein